MAAITKLAVGAKSEESKRSRFRSASQGKLEPDVIARQSRIALLAFQIFSDREAALLFLNGEDVTLGGRPIDIASENEAGAERIAAALHSHVETAAT